MEASGGDIGRHQDANLTVLHATQRSIALGLRAVTVEGNGRNTPLFELTRQAVCAVLSAGEHERALVLLDDLSRDLGALFARHTPEVVVDVVGSFIAHDIVDCGVVGELPNERLDVGSHGGRKQHHLTIARRRPDDASHAGQKAHVSHAVSFVDDHGRHRRKIEGALFEHVLQAAGTGHDDVDAEVEGLARDVVRGAAVNADDATTAVVGELRQFLLNLGGQFARGHENQGHRFTGTGLGEARHQRKAEGQRLAGAGDGFSDDVAPGEGVRNRGLLNGEGFGNTALFQVFDQIGRHAERGEGQRHITPTS